MHEKRGVIEPGRTPQEEQLDGQSDKRAADDRDEGLEDHTTYRAANAVSDRVRLSTKTLPR